MAATLFRRAPARCRRTLGFGLTLLLCVALAGGCGFHLRGSGGSLELPPVRVEGSDREPLVRELRQILAGRVDVAADAEAEDQHVLRIGAVETERRSVSITGEALAAEYALVTAVEFAVLDPAGRVLASDRLARQRVYRVDPGNLLGSAGEEELLRSEMQRELVNALLRRTVSAVNAPPASAGRR